LATKSNAPAFQGLDRRLDVAEGRDHRHRGVGATGGDLADQLDARAVRQAHVGQAKLIGVALQLAARFGKG
jgi:hypothetical protein